MVCIFAGLFSGSSSSPSNNTRMFVSFFSGEYEVIFSRSFSRELSLQVDSSANLSETNIGIYAVGSVGLLINFIEQSFAIFAANEDFPIPKGAAMTVMGFLLVSKESM